MLNIVGVVDAPVANTSLASGDSRAYIGLAPKACGHPLRSGEGQAGRGSEATPERAVSSGIAMPDVISVTPETIETELADLPRLVRLALGFGARLRRGTLDVTLPDGRVVRLGGAEPGPAAAMKLYNYGFASRLLNGGDIGIAEAYLNGEWDSPDLTQFPRAVLRQPA